MTGEGAGEGQDSNSIEQVFKDKTNLFAWAESWKSCFRMPESAVYLNSFHRTHDEHGLGDASPQPAQEPPLAVQFTSLIAHFITEELKHPKSG